MTYVTSDIFGNILAFAALLEKINFSDEDTLYVLGNSIGGHWSGFEVFTDIMKRPNVVLLMGESEYDLLKLLEKRPWNVKNPGAFNLRTVFGDRYCLQREDMKCYLSDCPYYKLLDTPTGNYLLCFGGIRYFEEPGLYENGKYDALIRGEDVFSRPEFADVTVITGSAGFRLPEDGYVIPAPSDHHITIGFQDRITCLCLENGTEYCEETLL